MSAAARTLALVTDPALRPGLELSLRGGAVAAAIALLAVTTTLGATLYDGMLILVFGAAILQSAAIAVGLFRPRVAVVLAVAGAAGLTALTQSSTGAPWPWSVSAIVAQALVLGMAGYRSTWRWGAGGLAASLVATGLLSAIGQPPHDQQTVAVNLVVFTSAAGATLAAGVILREWGAITAQLAVQRRLTDSERERRLMAEEKTRIARELHDVVAHSMSLISVQAASAPFRHPQADEPLRHEFEQIAASSRQALAEMRSLLSVLRDPDAPVARTPQPRLSGIAELVAQSRRGGLRVTLTGGDELADDTVSELVGLTAYRIVQEALSNVIRHAPGAAAEVLVRHGRALTVTVVNGPGGESTTHGSGHGLLGMRERAASAGGSCVYGPTAGGGYEVEAVLPLTEPLETP